MAGVVVSVATGALKPLVEKLAAALGDKYKRFKGVSGEINSLTKELNTMHDFLLKVSEEEDPDVQDKGWTKEVRELSYDMEDSLDEFMIRVDGKSPDPSGFINKCKNKWTEFKTRHKFVKVIEDLKLHVKDVGERHARYKTGEIISKRNNEYVDPRALVIFEESSKLVGIDEPKDEFIEFLKIKEECESSRQVKVVSIVGLGGLGKTALANQVYQNLKGQFECGAFVSVSRTPNVMRILRIILSEVSGQDYEKTKAGSIEQLIGQIRKYLEQKRYLIVIDDIWEEYIWKPINHALLKNSEHSRIITTTRMQKVAKACCSSDGDHVYKLRPLGPMESKKLFQKRVFGSEDGCPANLTEVTNDILEKCGGVPLAIISISGILANKAQTDDEWVQVESSIGRGLLSKDPEAQSMRQILSLSYFHLPHHLRTCLLYLSIFPEDYIIDKSRLIRRWIAEGFIPKEHGYSLYALGERCFNELINRSLIQPGRPNKYGDVTVCQVHDIILDFIVSKSQEENLMTAVGDGYQMPSAHCKVRRLSLRDNSKEKVDMMTKDNLSHIRSVTVFSCSVELHCWTKFHFLRVLDLQGCREVDSHHLADIEKLLQLRYLGLRETGVRELPEQIRKLQYLETLDLKKTKVTKLPNSIAQLRRLVYLAVDQGVKLPDGTGSMTSLEELDGVGIFKQSIDFTRELEKLINLRNIRLSLSSDDCNTDAEGSHYKEYMSNILSSLSKTDHLHSLSIDITEDISLDSEGGAPRRLQRFFITGNFISKVPNWVRSLVNLEVLTLSVKEFEVEDIMALGLLPALVFLQLIAHKSFQGRRFNISGTDGFPCLRHFDYGCTIPVTFEAGAMPKLEKLTLLFKVIETHLLARNEDFDYGFQHLSSLDMVKCMLYVDYESFVSSTDEKKIQMAEMSCEQSKALIAELETRASVFYSRKGAGIPEADGTHLSHHKLFLFPTVSWSLETKNTVAAHYLAYRARRVVQDTMEYIKFQAELSQDEELSD
ncbi:hypothetical protein ACP70R_015908 [Stipagrostis hirtigluma subsp. patula]